MNEQTQKVPFYKRKALVIPVALIMTIALISAVAQLYATVNVDATVTEALSTTTVNLDFSGLPGETICNDIDVANGASVPLDTQFSFTEVTNLNGVTYTTNMPLTQTLAPGANTVSTCITYADDSPIGDITASITLERIA